MTRTPKRLALAAAGVAFVVYALTAPRTITFWEGAHYSLLARTLSITNPPGSLLLTLIGWTLSHVPFAWPMAYRLNLIAALIGATVVAVLVRLGARVASVSASPGAADAGPGPAPGAAPLDATSSSGTPVLAGAALAGGVAAALLWGFAFAPWTYATRFAPYILSALSTALILAAFVRWWERASSATAAGSSGAVRNADAVGAAALVALLFGLDVSVHRTNLLLMLAAFAGLLLRRPRALLHPRFVAAIAGAFVLGAATQLLYIPLSLRQPFLDVWAPDSLHALWSYERLEGIGGGLLPAVWPRHADFVRIQLGDLARFARQNLGGAGAWPVATALVAIGFASLVRRSWRLALALLGFALVAGPGVVLAINRPPSYFRSLDRHYLAFLATLMPLLATGVAAIVAQARRRAGRIGATLTMVLAFALPASALIGNRAACDRSHARLAETFARDLLEPLPPRALLLTNGDNDSFPPWYLQEVEGVRPDVLVVNVPVAWTEPGRRRLGRQDPGLAGLAPSDTLIQDLVRRSLRRRPVCLAVTLVTPPEMPGIRERMRLEGLAWRVADPSEPNVDTRLERFVHERLPRAGLDDPRDRVDDDVQGLLENYASTAMWLANRQIARGEAGPALATLDVLQRSAPRLLGHGAPLDSLIADGRRRARLLPPADAARP